MSTKVLGALTKGRKRKSAHNIMARSGEEARVDAEDSRVEPTHITGRNTRERK